MRTWISHLTPFFLVDFCVLLLTDPSRFAFLLSITTLLYLCLPVLMPHSAICKYFSVTQNKHHRSCRTPSWGLQKATGHQKLQICYDIITCSRSSHQKAGGSRSAATQIPSFLWDLNVHYRLHKDLATDPPVNQFHQSTLKHKTFHHPATACGPLLSRFTR